MDKEIKAALAAAKKYKVRNEGDKPHAELIVALLTDANERAGALEGHADAYDKQQRINVAQDELRAAQAEAGG
jgi:hypothetical protein